MSRQNQKPHFVIIPDKISGPPTAADAAEICRLYDLSNQGLRAFVLMGFRLIAVKSRLPHGGYMPWLREHMGHLSERHMHRSRQVAEAIALRLKWDGQITHTVSNLEQEAQIGHSVSDLTELPPEVCELIDGKSGRGLLAELREPLSAETEKVEGACQVMCEEIWSDDPGKQDDFEPRVLSGEITYHRALTGMTGGMATSGKAKETREALSIFDQKLSAMKAPFLKLEKLLAEDPEKARDLKAQIAGWAKMDMSEAMRRIWLEALEHSLGQRGGLDGILR